MGTFNSLTAAQLSNWQCSIRESSTSANAELWLPALKQMPLHVCTNFTHRSFGPQLFQLMPVATPRR